MSGFEFKTLLFKDTTPEKTDRELNEYGLKHWRVVACAYNPLRDGECRYVLMRQLPAIRSTA